MRSDDDCIFSLRKGIEGVHDIQNTVPCTALPPVLCLDTLSMLYHRICREKCIGYDYKKNGYLSGGSLCIRGGTEIFSVSPLLPFSLVKGTTDNKLDPCAPANTAPFCRCLHFLYHRRVHSTHDRN